MKRSGLVRPWLFFLRHHELRIICLISITLFVALSLFSYTPHDQTWFTYATYVQPLKNWCGIVGAHLAACMFFMWGSSCWWFIALAIFYGYLLLYKKSLHDEWDRLMAYALMPWISALVLRLYGIDFAGTALPGGFFGHHMIRLLARWFDFVGTYLLVHTLLVMCVIIMTRFSVVMLVRWLLAQNIVQRTIKFIKPHIRHIMQVIRTWYSVPCHYLTQASHQIFGSGQSQQIAVDDELERVIYESPEQDKHNLATFWQEFSQAEKIIPAQQVTTQTFSEVQEPVVSDDGIEVAEHKQSYSPPTLDIFIGVEQEQNDVALTQELEKKAIALQEKLERFGVSGAVVSIKRGPVVTMYEYQPDIDAKISKIMALEDDLALALQALSIRIIAPIPGKSLVGFEVANKHRKQVLLGNLLKTEAYAQTNASLPVVLGEDTVGATVIIDLIKMPHLLMAGSTGSGKSVALNAMLISLLCKKSPDEVKLIVIDPKRLEFAPYADIAHLLFPIITDPRQAAPVLRWVVEQMEERYEKMAESGARNIHDYKMAQAKKGQPHAMPFIVVIIDELADLMMTAGREIEDLLIRITQMARAAGIHVIAATQRPSVDVITGLIKVNFSSRISFRVTSKVDSRTILDTTGADKLLGYGDMLFLDASDSRLKRIHGAYVSDKEINQVVSHIKSERMVSYLDLKTVCQQNAYADDQDIDDGLYQQVLAFLQEIDEVSISLLQRRFRIGYNRSARIIEKLELQGHVASAGGGRTRKVMR